MPPFDSSLGPVALADEAVRLLPEDTTYKVKAVEQMAKLGPYDFGSASANSTATESGSNIIELDDELEFGDGVLGQIWINPLSDVEVEVRQSGQQEQRFVNSNAVGEITMGTPAQMRQVFIHDDDVPHVIISNPNNYDLAKTLVYFTGYKLVLEDQPMRGEEAQRMRGEPAAVPVDSLKTNRV